MHLDNTLRKNEMPVLACTFRIYLLRNLLRNVNYRKIQIKLPDSRLSELHMLFEGTVTVSGLSSFEELQGVLYSVEAVVIAISLFSMHSRV